ncbi:hypothetical protein [Acetobacter sp.]|uniref:hypothetical protein n=1 Tax=Acetobacter sp. TaxID=440 RepID=UPI0039ED8E26
MSSDQALPLPARIVELRAKAEQRGLTLQEAMLAFCAQPKAIELLELDPHDVDYIIIRPSRSLNIRVELSAELKCKLLSGILVAHGLPLDAEALEKLQEIPAHFWDGATLYPRENQASDLDGIMIGRLRIKESTDHGAPPQVLPEPTEPSRKACRPKSEASQEAARLIREWLLDNGEDLKSCRGKQAECIRWVLGELSKKGFSPSESTLKTLVPKVANQIAAEKANNS